MAFIKTVPVKEATGLLARQYRAAIRRTGRVFNVVRIQSLNPRVLDASMNLYEVAMLGPSSLSRAEREMIAVVVSRENECFYWMEAHGEDLRVITGDDALVAQVKSDYRAADIDLRTRAMLDYAVMITREVHRVTRETIDGLRRAGLSDEDILNVAEIAGFFNYYNRMADALGVLPEDFMVDPGPGEGRR